MPNTLMLPVLTYYALGIMDSVAAQDNTTANDEWAAGWLATNSATFGAYQYDGVTPGEEVSLLENPNCWNAAAVDIDRIIMSAVPESGNRMRLVGFGDVAFVGDLTFDLFASFANAEGVVLAFEDATDRHVGVQPASCR